jgi:hypothetical protein
MFGGPGNHPSYEWIDYILLTEIYHGLRPDEIDALPARRVETDLMMYQIASDYRNKN